MRGFTIDAFLNNCWLSHNPRAYFSTVPSRAFVTSMSGLMGAILLLVASFAVHASEARPTVAWDTSGLSVATYKRLDALNLERRAVLRFIEDGFAVVGLPAQPRVVVRLKDSGEGIALEVSGDRGARSHQLTLDGSALAEVHLEIMQRCVTMAKAVLGPTVDSEPKPSVEPTPPPSTLKIDVSIAGGGVWRSKTIDPALGANFGMSFTDFLGLHLKGGVAWFSSSQISVQDWNVLLGPRGELPLTPSWRLELALLGGVRIHAAQVPSPVEGSGTRVDVMGAILLRVRRELTWGLGMELGLCGGLSPGIHHRLGNVQLWERGPASLEATLGFGWRG